MTPFKVRSAAVIVATLALLAGPASAFASINSVSASSQTPSPVTQGSSASFTASVTDDHDHDVSITAVSGVTGISLGSSACVYIHDSAHHDITFSVNTTGSTPTGSNSFTVTATQWSSTDDSCGGTNEGTGTGSATLVVAAKTNTTTAVVSTTGTPTTYGAPVALKATVTGTTGTTANGDTVTFKDGSATLGTGTLSSGVATFTTTGTQLSATSHTITAVFAGDSNYNISTSTSITQVVNAKALTVTGLSASSKVYTGTNSATLTGPASLLAAETAPGTPGDNTPYSGDTVSVTGTPVGTFASVGVANVITVNVAGLSLTGAQSTDYSLIAPSLSANITQATPILSWSTPSDITYGTALSVTQLDANSNVAGSFVYTPDAGTVLDAGASQTLGAVFAPTDPTDYVSGGTVGTTINVGMADQTISFGSLSDKTFGDSDFPVNATGGASGNSVTFSTVSTACSVTSGGTVHLISAGSCNITASQAGNTNYSAASNVSQSFSIAQATPSFSNLAASQSITAGATSITLSGIVSASGPVYPTSGDTITVTIDGNPQTTTINDSTGDFSFSYNPSTILASVTPYTITYSYAGDTNFTSASDDTSTTLTVNPGSGALDVNMTIVGGTATPGQFGIEVNGGSEFLFDPDTATTGHVDFPSITLDPRTTVETTIPAGYVASYDAGCTNATITAGDTTTCNITDTYVAPTTDPSPAVTSSDATLGGTNGGDTATQESFWVSLAPFATSTSDIPSGVYSTPVFTALAGLAPGGTFSTSLSTLNSDAITTGGATGVNLPTITPSTTYHYVAWSLVNSTWYPGAEVSFTTAAPVLSSADDITSFGFGLTGEVDSFVGTDINVTVPSGTGVTNLTPTIVISPDATVVPNSGTQEDFTNPVDYTVTAQDSVTNTYTVTVTVAPAPVVTTDTADVTGDTTATLNGTDGPTMADNTSFWYGPTSAGSFTSGSDPASSQFPVGWSSTGLNPSANAGADFSQDVTGLEAGTTYYVAAWSEIGGIWYPGDVVPFTTTGTAPTTPNPTTGSATSVDSADATLNAANGDTYADNTSFWYGTGPGGPFTSEADPASDQLPAGWSTTGLNPSANAGAGFSDSVGSLSPSTGYNFAAWSEVGGIWYPGAVESFTTSAPPPSPPTAYDDSSETTDTVTPIDITLTSSDGGSTYAITQPANGTAVLSGTGPDVTYTPSGTFAGPDTFTFTATDGGGTSNVATVTVTVNDTIPPVVTLNGNATAKLAVNAPYLDLGANATDNVDLSPDIVASVDGAASTTIAGISINTSTPGTHTILFGATDEDGNVGYATRTVIVSGPPVITLNGSDTIDLTVGDTYTEQGATATDLADGTDTVTPSGTVDTTTPGTYTITYNATDSVGNDAVPVTRTVNVSAASNPNPAPSGGGGSNGAPVGLDFAGGPIVNLTTPPVPGQPTGPQGQVLGASAYNFTVNFGIGTKDEDVTQLQLILIADGYLKIPAPTGYFGPLTLAAVKLYQSAHGITPVSGYVGPKTRAVLNGGTVPTTTDENGSLILSLQEQLQQVLAQLAAMGATTTGQ